jgi:DNA (cytosine-5)-methyltransferase 1
MKDGKKYKLLSLFSGCGGMDLGFEGDFMVNKESINQKHNPDFIKEEINKNQVKLAPTVFETVFANDILVDARKAWNNYFKKRGSSSNVFHLGSIVELVKKHHAGEKVFPENIDIVTGGFPCQDFSVSGKRKGLNSHKDHNGKLIKSEIPSVETRGHLYMWMKQVIDIVQPKIFIAENVKGLVNLSNIKEVIQKDFASANGDGYLVLQPQVLNASHYGVPQSRERVFFIGIKKNELNKKILKELEKTLINPEYSPYPAPSHSNNPGKNGYLEPVKLKDIFKTIDEPEISSDPSQVHFSKAKYMGKHCQGQSEIKLNNIGPTIRAEHHGNIEFRRLSANNGGMQLDELKKGLKERRLTVRECALIQTFPRDFEFVIPSGNRKFFISPSSAYKLIGNAVPPLLAYHIAKRIEKLWDMYFE